MDGGEEKLLDTLISLLVRNFYNLIECAHYTDNQHRIMLLGERDYILESLGQPIVATRSPRFLCVATHHIIHTTTSYYQ